MQFTFAVPTQIVSQAGISALAGEQLAKLNMRNILVVTDAGIKAAGLLRPIYSNLTAHNIAFSEFSQVQPNPRSEDCQMAAERYRQQEGQQSIQGILAIGGGSVIDSAKVISILLTNAGEVLDFVGKREHYPYPPVPLVVIPTTAGTGSEVTFSSVITDSKRKVKLTIGSPQLGPVLALLDPDITASLPAPIAASTGVDALTHAIEAYTARCNNPISDALALHAIGLISQNLIASVNEPSNSAAKHNMLVASTIAGMAFGNTDVASVHCISEALGGMYDTPHGVANAIFLPFVFAHNCDTDITRHAQVAYALGVDASLSAEEAVEQAMLRLFAINKALHIPHFKDLPLLDTNDFLSIAEKSKNNGSDASNAKAMTVDSYLTILNSAYKHAE